MFRDLLLPITGTPTDAATVESGVRLARALGAHLSVLETVSLPMSMPAPWGGGIPEALLQDLHAALLERGAANVAKLRGRLAGEGIAHEVRLAEALFAEPPQLAALIDRLSTRLGRGRVRRFAPRDRHLPEQAEFMLPAGRRPASPGSALAPGAFQQTH